MDRCLDVNKLYAEDPKLKKDDVEVLMIWCQQQRHFPQVAELQVALALHACFYSVEQAKNCLENYFTIRTMCPELFQGGNPSKDPALRQEMNVSLLGILPKKTKEGYTVILTKLIDTNPNLYNPQTDSKLFDMHVMRHVHVEGPANGFVGILDMKGGVFGHITKLNLSEYKKFLVYLQTAMPIRLMAIHFINPVPFMDKLMAILKPFINKEMFEKIHIHSNINNFYKYVPQEILPTDYGGNEESVAIQHEIYKKAMFDNQWFFDFQDTMVVDEKKRIGPRKNADSLFGFDGTFKKLTVD
ncbi:unnamed protein product [Ceutorhynchus assimilis]|uniref:CRAL-TRIO domain-containing protein n=1 Tax=Ceutorhynchus assimilis TaxID=467358 RepID=A0A9N9MUK4_9CUCU|nr:unnamed protein product [Ceutorhynchus assimilis]